MDELERERRTTRWRGQLPAYAVAYEDLDRDNDLRLVIFTKAFNVWPLHRQQSLELTLIAYVEETGEAPIWVLEKAVRYLLNAPGSSWRPTPGQIREMAAIASQNVSRYLRGATDEIEPISRRYEIGTSGIAHALRSARELVGQPHPEVPQGFITPVFAAAMVDAIGGLPLKIEAGDGSGPGRVRRRLSPKDKT